MQHPVPGGRLHAAAGPHEHRRPVGVRHIAVDATVGDAGEPLPHLVGQRRRNGDHGDPRTHGLVRSVGRELLDDERSGEPGASVAAVTADERPSSRPLGDRRRRCERPPLRERVHGGPADLAGGDLGRGRRQVRAVESSEHGAVRSEDGGRRPGGGLVSEREDHDAVHRPGPVLLRTGGEGDDRGIGREAVHERLAGGSAWSEHQFGSGELRRRTTDAARRARDAQVDRGRGWRGPWGPATRGFRRRRLRRSRGTACDLHVAARRRGPQQDRVVVAVAVVGLGKVDLGAVPALGEAGRQPAGAAARRRRQHTDGSGDEHRGGGDAEHGAHRERRRGRRADRHRLRRRPQPGGGAVQQFVELVVVQVVCEVHRFSSWGVEASGSASGPSRHDARSWARRAFARARWVLAVGTAMPRTSAASAIVRPSTYTRATS